MKILIITFDIGTTSSGISTSRIINELVKNGHEVTVVTGSADCSKKKYKVIKCSPNPLKPARLLNYLGNILKTDINYMFWELRAYFAGKKILKKFLPDVIYSRSSPGCSFKVGLKLSLFTNIPLVLHFADPIPATLDWHPNSKYRRKMVKTVLPSLIHASSISFVNDRMKLYQQNTTNVNLEKKSIILPNPIPIPVAYSAPNSKPLVFTFFGSFIGSRNPRTLLAAFLKILHEYPMCELRIYGTKYNEISDYLNRNQLAIGNIKIFDRTSDMNKAFKESSFLIDIDSDCECQVFSSNKLMEYLSVNRFIISITPYGSPASMLLKNLNNTCFVTDHNIDNIYNAFKVAINTTWSNDLFEERNLLRTTMSIKNITGILEEKFLSLIRK